MLEDDFSRYGDEPAHYVSSLMVKDYLRSGLSGHPIRFAERYYAHYPKVAIGHWPPGFHAALGVWMLLFGASRAAVLAFLTVTTVLVSFLLWVTLRRRVGWAAACCAAVSYPLLPTVETQVLSVMTELPSALWQFLALLSLASYMDRGERRWAAAFAVTTLGAILTRPDGWQLGLTTLLSFVLSGRWRRLFAGPLLLAATVVLSITLPFYLFFINAMKDGVVEMPWTAYTVAAAPVFGAGAFRMLTPVPALLLLASLVFLWRARPVPPYWAVMFSGAVVALLFPILMPASFEERHLLPFAAPALALAAYGLSRLASPGRQIGAAALTVLATAVFVFTFYQPPEPKRLFSQAAALLAAEPFSQVRPMMISSNSNGEGRFIAGLAQQNGGCCWSVVLRATKQMASTNWQATRYELRYPDLAAAEAALARQSVNVLILHDEDRRRRVPHHAQLQQIVDGSPGDWQLVHTLRAPATSRYARETVRIYRHTRLFGHAPPYIDINLSERLGRPLRLQLDNRGGRALP